MEMFDHLANYKIFLAAAECGSISKAAERLYLSQPAVSMSIKKLEESLQTTLFIRKPNGVVLTEKGRQLRNRVETAFNMLSDAEQNLKCSQDSGHLRIAASNVLCKYILMPYLKKFTEQYPDTDVSITCTSSANAYALLEKCSIDLALAAKPEHLEAATFHSLGVIEYIFVCTPAYQEKMNCKDDDIFQHGKIMLLDRDNVSRIHIDQYYAKNNIVPSFILEVNDMDMLIEFAKMGIGISCVVKQFVEEELDARTLVEIELSKPVPSREIGFLYHQMQPFNENIVRLIGIEK